MRSGVILCNVSIAGGRRRDVGIAQGAICDPAALSKAIEIDASRLTAMPGLIDHHLHILATAAANGSMRLEGLTEEDAVIAALRGWAAAHPHGGVRAIGYDERAAGLPDRAMLDRWLPGRELRVQDRTGALWVLSSRFVGRLGDGPFPPSVECDADGVPTGRIWRGDRWLRDRLGAILPEVGAFAATLARYGIVGVTDATPDNGGEAAALFAALAADGCWPLDLQLMGNEALPGAARVWRGPLKLHFDEYALPPLPDLAERVATARAQCRSVAAHCTTEAELVWFLAALEMAGGARPGDRIEHGAMIPLAMVAQIAAARLAVVSNPGFIDTRGDRYLRTVPEADQSSLYRLRSLCEAGITLAIGSDAPYGPTDPWRTMRAARDRRTRGGGCVGAAEGISVVQSLEGYWRSFDLASVRTLAMGEPADLCLLRGDWSDILADPDGERVAATFVRGVPVFAAGDVGIG